MLNNLQPLQEAYSLCKDLGSTNALAGHLEILGDRKEFLTREDIPPESKQKIASENPRRLYGAAS